MFSSHYKLKRKTPAQGINRPQFIEHLVEEYHTTTNVEAQEQVSANLANFAYDPINWQYLKQSDALDLFLELLTTQNEKLQLHGSAGLCNICLDTDAAKFMTTNTNVKIIKALLLSTENTEILTNCITLFYQLLSKEQAYKEILVTPTVLKCISNWRQQSKDQRLLNLCNIFLEDYGSRSEVVELQSTTSPENATTSIAAASLLSSKNQTERSATS